jgi:adenine-specific DNA-methyltransferase
MGTKRELAPVVARVIGQAKPGLLLDAFAGMGAVAEATAPTRQVWTNDVQHFAHLVTKAMFTSKHGPLTAAEFAAVVEHRYEEKEVTYSAVLKDALALEAKALQATEFKPYVDLIDEARHIHADLLANAATSPSFSSTYAWTYFGLRQCVELDSARSSIDILLAEKAIDADDWQWALLALGKAALRVANTPGHFAQYLRLHERTFARTKRLRRRSVWAEWLIALSEMASLGTLEWRQGNRATRADSLELLASHDGAHPSPSVVYCDPPYTDDQYSRFYHVLETLVLYDSPAVTGAGQYRGDRFNTPFSVKGCVDNAFECLVSSVANLGADLVLSYPSNGLLYEAGFDPMSLLGRSYKTVQLVTSVPHTHSTFGASKGVQKANVEEQIFWAQQ